MIEVELNLKGMPITLVDTAGLREAEDAVERIGVGRARARAGEADLLLWLSEGGVAPPPDVDTDGAEILGIAAKADEFPPQVNCLAISARTGLGIDELCEEIATRAGAMLGDGSSALVIRERHRDAIGAARDFIAAALTPGRPLELVAEEIRLAARSLERIIGAIDVEQILDVVFSRFCIGK